MTDVFLLSHWCGQGIGCAEGGNVWRNMLPADADDKYLDDLIKESLGYIKGMF